MPDTFERRARLVMLAYTVLGGMEPPPPELPDKDILLALASEALKKAAEMTGPPKLEPPERREHMWRQGFGQPPKGWPSG